MPYSPPQSASLHTNATLATPRHAWSTASRRARLVAATLISTLAFACSGEEVVKWDAQYVRVTSPAGVEVSRLAFSLYRANDAAAPLMRPAGDEDGWEIVAPNPLQLTQEGVLIKLSEAQGGGGAWLRGLALSDGKVVAAGVIFVDTSKRGDVRLKLVADDPCDADRDGARDCGKAGCCAPNEPSDCNDVPGSGATSNPWIIEAGCEACDNNVDEDCDGEDLSCVDSDEDGYANCKEATCGPEAASQPTVYPGAPELCDGLDNDCNGKTDDALPYTPIHESEPKVGLGAACGLGACAGGETVCTKDGAGMTCSSATKLGLKEDCATPVDDDCDGKINEGCSLDDPDGDGVDTPTEAASCTAPLAALKPKFHPGAKEGCCLTYTALVLQLAPDWQPGKTIPAGAKPTKKMLEVCDFSCDSKITPCDPEDEDGDGVVAPLDCDDTDPLRFPGAPERCGDGVLQSCVGVDPSCDGVPDKDGDGWADKDDCAEDDKTRHPGAPEICNGLDDDCDGVVDDLDAAGDNCTTCGESSCAKACLHASETPATGVCALSPWQPSSGTCFACVAIP